MKDLFNKIAKAASVYLDPYGENELKRLELSDRKSDLEKIRINSSFNISDWPNKKDIEIFSHEIDHAAYHSKIEELKNSPKTFNFRKPLPNIGILPPDAAPVAQIPEMTAAQRAAQVASVMAEGVQGNVAAPRTARFRKQGQAI